MGYYGFAPYVPVAKRREKAKRQMEKLRKKGKQIFPIEIAKRKIAHSFWGKSWCDHIESFSDYDNRLPRGRTYVRNGSVCHLEIKQGEIEAIVSGSSLYNVCIKITQLSSDKWSSIKSFCTGKIGSLIDLLNGKLSDGVMHEVCDRNKGLFPLSNEIKLSCSCPDWADMCKHVAAVLYGVGARLDDSPEQLFQLRGVKYNELIDISTAVLEVTKPETSSRRHIADNAIGDVFGIEMADEQKHSQLNVEKPIIKSSVDKKKSNKKQVIKKMVSKQQPTSPMKNPPKYFSGNMIRKKRQELGLTQSQFSRQISVTAATVSRWESFGRRKILISVKNKESLLEIWL